MKYKNGTKRIICLRYIRVQIKLHLSNGGGTMELRASSLSGVYSKMTVRNYGHLNGEMNDGKPSV
jgi:hypothetical protein